MTMREAIIAVISGPEAISCDLFEELAVFRLENNDYAVLHFGEDGLGYSQEEFKTPEEAVDRFFELRQIKRLGFDFEKSNNSVDSPQVSL